MLISHKRQTRGFTLIELLVVISIVSLMASIVTSSLATARSKARDTARIQTLKQVQTALELYRSDNSNYPNISTGPVGINRDANSWTGGLWLDAALFPVSGTKYFPVSLHANADTVSSYYFGPNSLTTGGWYTEPNYAYVIVWEIENLSMAKYIDCPAQVMGDIVDALSSKVYCVGVRK